MPTPEQIQRALKGLQRPDLDVDSKEKILKHISGNLDPATLQQEQMRLQEARQVGAAQQNDMWQQMETGQEAQAPPAGPAGPAPEPQQSEAPVPQMQAPAGSPQVDVGEAELWGEDEIPIRYDQATYALDKAWRSTDTHDSDPIDVDDPASIARHRKRIAERQGRTGRNPAYKSASQLEALYAPPEAGFRGVTGDDESPYLHHEPEVEEVSALIEALVERFEEEGADKKKIDKRRRQLVDLEERGTEAEIYQKYADWKWQNVAKAANEAETPQRAVRVAYTEDDSYKTSKAQMIGLSIMDGLAGGFGLVPAVADLIDGRKNTPVGRQLLKRGFGIGKGDYTRMADDAPMWTSLVGTGLGLAVAGPGKLVQTGIGKLGKTLGKKGARRVATDLALNFGIDMTASAVRQGIEAVTEGRDADFSLVQATVEGLVGGGLAAGGSLVGETGRGIYRGIISTDPRIRAQVEAGNVTGHGTGRKGLLTRMGETEVNKPRLRKPLSFSRSDPSYLQDDLIERSIDATLPKGPKSKRSSAGTLGEAADYAARETLPTLNKKTQARMRLMNIQEQRLASTEEGKKKIPVTRAFKGLVKFWRETHNSSDSARRKAFAALSNIADIEVVSEAGVEAARLKIKAGKAGVSDSIIIPFDSSEMKMINRDQIAKAESAFNVRHADEAAKIRKDDAKSRHTIDFASPLYANRDRLPDLDPEDSHVVVEDAREELMGDYMSFLPGGKRTVPKADPALEEATNPGRGPGGRARTTAKAPPGTPENPALEGRAPVKGEISQSLQDAAPPVKKYLVLKPRQMDAIGFLHAKRDIDDALFSNEGEAGGGEALRNAAAVLRETAAEWRGLPELIRKQRRILTELETIEGGTKLTRRQMSGDYTDELDAGSVRDASLIKLARHIENDVYADTAADSLQSEALANYLDNPRLTALLKGVRAVEAYVEQQGGPSKARARVGVGGSGPFGVVSDIVGWAKDKSFRPGSALMRAQDSGNMPRHIRKLFTPESRQFLATIGEETLIKLLEAEAEKEIREEDK